REFDFVVTDLEMPGTRGDEFAMLVHQLNPQVNITIVSGAIGNVSMEAAKISTLVEKPFSLETLAKKMLDGSETNSQKVA
ncbi:response regulator, partial [Saprospiraceae bacterium]|nr:response regulator [Saprospiraceae bacterium]